MVGFLNTGKGLYVEGADIGYNNQNPTIWPYLGTAYLGDGYGSSTGNVDELTGVAGTIGDGFSAGFPYKGYEGPDNYVDEFGVTGNGTVIIECQNNIGRVVVNEDSTLKADYKTICASACFTYYGYGETGIKSASLGEIKAVYK